MSKSILVWNWRYRIFFNSKILADLEEFIESLKDGEKEIYNKIKDFYLGFYSISILLDEIEVSPDRASDIIPYAQKRRNLLVQTPSMLYSFLRDRIVSLNIDDAQKQQLYDLLESSLKTDYCVSYSEIAPFIFGETFYRMECDISRVSQIEAIDHGEIIPSRRTQALQDDYYKKLKNDLDLIKRFGACPIESYKIQVKPGSGFAEWWDRDLTSDNSDLLIIFTNSDSQNTNDLFYTIVHEMYPGHGFFYNNVAHTGSLMDHGAMALIEGWATYAEWHAVESDYSKNIRNNSLYFLKEMKEKDLNKRATKIYNKKLAQGYSETEALRTIDYATQYIGFLDSYYYGALFIELFLFEKKLSPKDFINFLCNNNIGDFFAIWTEKNITSSADIK